MAFLRTLNLYVAERVLVFLVWEYQLYLKVFGVKTPFSINSFLSQKADSKEMSEELVKSWRLDQVRGRQHLGSISRPLSFLGTAACPARVTVCLPVCMLDPELPVVYISGGRRPRSH